MRFLLLCLTALGSFGALFFIAKLDLSEFMIMCRQQGYFDLTNIQTAVFEYNGKLTILPVSSQRPATPKDMNLAPEQELLFTELTQLGDTLITIATQRSICSRGRQSPAP